MRTVLPKTVTAAIFAFLALLLATPGTASAFTPWTGQISANINLRAAPGLNGRIITGLERGSLVKVRDQQGDWYQIERQSDNFGYIGWVYGKYVVALSETASEPAGQVQPAAPIQAVSEPSAAGAVSMASPGPVAPLQTQPPAEPPAPVASISRPLAKSAPPVDGPAPVTATAAVEAKEPAPLRPSIALAPQPQQAARKILAPAPPPQAAQAPAFQPAAPQAVDMAPASAVNISTNPSLPELSRQPAKEQPPVQVAASTGNYAGPRTMVSLLLRLTTTVVSCLALLLAFKAFQTARANRALILERIDA